ncbi:hypothetical protein LMIV_0855 [Listeria monocytogenes FSL J1-208]|uniref:hypothetical protein n=1 Tax=Listeria monocytogenes TaxID=1639 RepID=UPI000254882E|nr:hypothetical protein [Listeria monocytogenes]EAE5920760.1 hypothetical protein [Listeria monocytogenes]EAG6686393.1 hypothetical protein [Listeria monocytogenes]EHY63398.1 hypothetical protein LMIV_0855 [Listeria monocytogenes FSL J1-208]OEO46353.1 hypothetical protein AJZ74_08360 [Listeria monocytogenes]QOF63365.1 hypothetical protein IFI77_05350 [Listeria monocytogenes FSL J1-208]
MIYYKDKLKTLGTSLTSLSFILMFGLLTILSIEKPESFYFGLITIFFLGRFIIKLLLPPKEWIQVTKDAFILHTRKQTKTVYLANVKRISYNFRPIHRFLKSPSPETMELFFQTESKMEKFDCAFIGRSNFVELINQFDAKLASLSEDIITHDHRYPLDLVYGVFIFGIVILFLIFIFLFGREFLLERIGKFFVSL